ncbi:SAG-related sequence SRS21 [Toxoplasma gondii TgCatPRC2]|uniref:SRS21 n=15 Tax=Toxoplasma gondii TaxID=5811 RepID=B9PSV2_TOXGV|nr:SAG-related sequence SRS21 [Toxoplasma gondii ME49]EPR59279.1 SAG-related sequence SRS21 [Toxoplasma gondii GT1]ESS30521.1 SAG-related sequence SRS21 [Toxoplasma gondii VEG]KAF4643982.1 SAG-related sequence SRS21 [Toxoplasma gondii]KFG28205.1 SAG-related sequence SRS21 [Toxoplasma gondii p89]KFG30100.1 SAG-related sequence SRS21 [Toxoplasma gondii GAB2-2007-GAL-DOM2]KFG33516.1 SAG-related sequence SRS21 [Toxoplasma gondii FOU]KFG63440.1 SAG-related sequence SRS21 [Toxoplasma gondii RUB]K|eukprot:XP_002369105.1 SAG-related sequence SRS21 [Toxoplasma gondii ME49]
MKAPYLVCYTVSAIFMLTVRVSSLQTEENLCDDISRGLSLVVDSAEPVVFRCSSEFPLLRPEIHDHVYTFHEGVCEGPVDVKSLISGASVEPRDGEAVLHLKHLPRKGRTLCFQCQASGDGENRSCLLLITVKTTSEDVPCSKSSRQESGVVDAASALSLRGTVDDSLIWRPAQTVFVSY